MILGIIILSIITLTLLIIIFIIGHELKIEIDTRQYFEKIAREKIKENDKMKKIK